MEKKKSTEPELKTEKKKGFLAKLIEKMDKKLEEKSKQKSCCCGTTGKKDGNSCC